jgi:hypothetical protein
MSAPLKNNSDCIVENSWFFKKKIIKMYYSYIFGAILWTSATLTGWLWKSKHHIMVFVTRVFLNLADKWF